jgi:uncharacterized GH25 family protein
MRMTLPTGLAVVAVLAGAPSAAHVLWINVVPQAQDHVIVSLGYGDFMPGSELMTTEWGAMSVTSYDLITPDGSRSSLGPPQLVTLPIQKLPADVTLQPIGDTGIRKVAFSPASRKGTYQVAAQSPVFEFTRYKDRAGKVHYTDQPIAKVKGVAQVIDRSFEIMFMKATFSLAGWSEPAPLGQLFEIVPLTDLSEARVGDKVRFKVLFDGKAWSWPGISPQLTAQNMSLGDTWALQSPLAFGEGEFRLSHAGMWKVNARFRALAGSDERIAKLAPKATADTPVFFETTFVMNIQP